MKKSVRHHLTISEIRESWAAIGFLTPAFFGLIFITYIPLFAVFAISLFKWAPIMPKPIWVGFANYKKMFGMDLPMLTNSIKVTVLFALMSVVGSMIYSMFLAILLNRKMPARGFFRAVFYLPYIIPATATYTTWRFLLDANFGALNGLRSSLGLQKIGFLIDPKYIIPSLALITIWISGNLVVVKLAGLGNVPRVYYEAAEIDGANAWTRFWRITIPCMSPIIFYNMLMSLVTNMQSFIPSWMYAGSNRIVYPEYNTISYIIYQKAFGQGQSDMGYASALSVIFFVIVGLLTLALFATSKSWLFYEGGTDK